MAVTAVVVDADDVSEVELRSRHMDVTERRRDDIFTSLSDKPIR
jgi:hypothetical protein